MSPAFPVTVSEADLKERAGLKIRTIRVLSQARMRSIAQRCVFPREHKMMATIRFE